MTPQTVTLLTNFVPPYLESLFAALAGRVRRLRILVSTGMEANRPWRFEVGSLPVRRQRTLTLRQRWRHPQGFSENNWLHLPLDTIGDLVRTRPTVIVSTEFGLRTLQAIAYRALRRRTRLVLWAPVSEVTERGRGALREALRRWMLARVDAVIVSGRSGARYVARLGFPRDAIFEMPPYAAPPEANTGASEASSAPPASASRPLLYVGQLVERKGLASFLCELSRWAEENPEREIACWIVGDGPARPELEALGAPPNLELRFVGNVAYAELPDYYRRAGLLVFPTLADEWGVVVNEAIAAGVPVLGSLHSQAVDELVEEGETGWRFHPDRPEELRAALGRALATPAGELDRMRTRCRERAASFAPEIVVGRMLEAIEFAAASARAGEDV